MQEAIRAFLREKLNQEIKILQVMPLSGGDINEVYQINTNVGRFCVKKNDTARFPGMFEAEAKGLNLLRDGSSFTIPEIIGCFSNGPHQFLIMEFIDSGTQTVSFWGNFGHKLAEMHLCSDEIFGLDHDNYIGSLQQSNKNHSSWSDFYANERILPQMKMALSRGLITQDLMSSGEVLCSKLDQLFPKEAPSLLHGDLWSGNYMTSSQGDPVLIDPAVYFGHREMDFGMMHLFGGFPLELFEAYNEVFPMESQWKERLSLAQLYPLLVHLNLFGKSYAKSVQTIVLKYS